MMKNEIAAGCRRVAVKAGVAMITALGALMYWPGHAIASGLQDTHKATPTEPTVMNYAFSPNVVSAAATGNIRLSARLAGPLPTSVKFVSAWGTTYDVFDNGGSDDAVAGDGVYSVMLPVAQILSRRTSDDVFRVFSGYLDVYSGSVRLERINVFAQVRSSDIPTATVRVIGSGAQLSANVLNISSATLFRTHMNDTPAIDAVAQLAYQSLTDQFDFLNLVFDRAQIENRYHFATRQPYGGIGQSTFNNNGLYGGASRLLGITVFPSAVFFDGADAGHQHELGHQWINFLDNSALAPGVPHWPPSTMATGLMGMSIVGSGAGGQFSCDFTAEGNGLRARRATTETNVRYNPLDLYLMGLLPAAEVPDQWVVTDPAFAADWATACDGRLLTSGFQRLTVNDVIAANGARTPGFGASQRTFRVATVVVSDGLLSADAMSFYDYFAKRMEARDRVRVHVGLVATNGSPFFWATGGRGALVATVDPQVQPASQVTMVEYFHPQLNYYFITSRENEKALLDAVPAWTKTGSSFRMMLNPDASLGGVTRFYFDKIAKNFTRGSHFYTISATDVATLQALNPDNAALPQKPVNESVDSFAWSASGAGPSATCPVGSVPVYRLFRGSKFPDDPNHRFTTALSVYNQFVALGWDGEGVAFCAPAN